MGKPGRKCLVCTDDRRADIEKAMLAGISHAAVARNFAIDRFAIGRHARFHTEQIALKKERIATRRERIKAAANVETVRFVSPEIVVEQTEALYSRIQALLGKAEAEGDYRLALSAIREAKDVLANFARMFSLFKDEQPPLQVSNQTRIINVIGAQPEETLRAFLAGNLPALPPSA